MVVVEEKRESGNDKARHTEFRVALLVSPLSKSERWLSITAESTACGAGPHLFESCHAPSYVPLDNLLQFL